MILCAIFYITVIIIIRYTYRLDGRQWLHTAGLAEARPHFEELKILGEQSFVQFKIEGKFEKKN